jgi:hypothetical protein
MLNSIIQTLKKTAEVEDFNGILSKEEIAKK